MMDRVLVYRYQHGKFHRATDPKNSSLPRTDVKEGTGVIEVQRQLVEINGTMELGEMKTKSGKGVSPKVVQERLGHSNITITLQTYIHVMPRLQAGAAVALNGIFTRNSQNGIGP
jgi:integrase